MWSFKSTDNSENSGLCLIPGTTLNSPCGLYKVRTHPSHYLYEPFALLPSDCRYVVPTCRTNRVKNSFVPGAIGLVSNSLWLCLHVLFSLCCSLCCICCACIMNYCFTAGYKQITLGDNKDFLCRWTVLHGLLLNSKFWSWLTSFVFHDFIMFVPLVTKLTDFRCERHGLFKITLELSNINTKSKILTDLYGDWEQKIHFHPLRIFALCSWSWEVVSLSQKDRQTLALTFKV